MMFKEICQKKEVFIFGPAFSLYQSVIKEINFGEVFIFGSPPPSTASLLVTSQMGKTCYHHHGLGSALGCVQFFSCNLIFVIYFFASRNYRIGEDCSIASIDILLASVLMREGVAAKQIYNHNEINSKLHKVNQLQNSKRCKFLSKEKRNGN